jgi:hypothetical protein
MMKSAALVRLQRLFGVAKTAEESRLAKALTEIAACRARAVELHLEIGGACGDAASSGEISLVADLAVRLRWDLRLMARAEAEDAQAEVLESEAAKLREILARAFGRESVAAAMVNKARVEERRLIARRAEEAKITPREAGKNETGTPDDQ